MTCIKNVKDNQVAKVERKVTRENLTTQFSLTRIYTSRIFTKFFSDHNFGLIYLDSITIRNMEVFCCLPRSYNRNET